MACFHPLKGYWSKTLNPSGKRSIVFAAREAYTDLKVDIPCGQCMGCRLERSRQWAIRCLHEASLYEDNAFVTLTYSDDKLPLHNSLQKSDYQKFMKRLRKRFPDRKIRFFHAGEYGEKLSRPHYHACLFNFDFPDKKLYKTSNSNKLFTSKILESLWPHGISITGDVTFESAAYVARYITKKILGPMAENFYTHTDEHGEVHPIQPEYVTMSRRPGIGKPWLDKYKTDVFPHDFVVVRGKKMKVPKFYEKELEKSDPSTYKKIKWRRESKAEKNSWNNTHERLKVRETVLDLKFAQLVRGYEK